MAFIDDLEELFPDTITATPGTLDLFGKFVASGATISIPAHIEGESLLVLDANTGKEIVSNLQIYCGEYNNLTTDEHRYTIPARFDPNENLRAVGIEKADDELGQVYETILLQKK